MRERNVVFDAEASARTKDDNGYLHVRSSHITKAVVNPYYGSEIPGWKERGLDPNELYYGYRDPDELKKSLATWEGLPLHMEHHVDSADDPQKDTRVGSVGTGVKWNAPYIDAPLTIWDQSAIDAIESGDFKALSCGYRYEPDWTPGEVDGVSYDFVMRDISGNHVALVADGRAGPDVVVADQNISPGGKNMSKEQEQVDLAQAIIDLMGDVTEDDDKVEALRTAVDELTEKVEPDQLGALVEAVEAFAAPAAEDEEEGADEDPEPQPETADEGEAMPADNEEGIKSAMDECGLDSDDPDEVKAFKAGMEFAQAAAEGAADEDTTEDEDEGASDEEAEDEDEPKGASDHKARRRKRMAMDANAVKRQAVEHMRSLYKACDTVKPLVGELKVHAFDSASDVYGHALKKSGINPADYPRSAWAGMVSVLLRKAPNGKPMAADAKPMSFEGPFAYLKNIVR